MFHNSIFTTISKIEQRVDPTLKTIQDLLDIIDLEHIKLYITPMPKKQELDLPFKLSPLLKEFQVFEAIYREGSISRASVKLSIDQGNVSRSLKRLEDSIETKLFNRFRGGVRPNSKADELYLALTQMNDVWGLLQKGALTNQMAKTIKIGTHSSLAFTYLGKIIEYINTNHPELYFDVVFDTSLNITQKVQQREIDIGIVANLIKSEDIVIKDLSTERIELCAIDDTFENKILIRNPQMLFIEKLIKGHNFKKVIDMSDYDVAASICESNKSFCCIIPNTIRNRHQNLKALKVLKDKISIKLISYPGNEFSGLLSNLAKAYNS